MANRIGSKEELNNKSLCFSCIRDYWLWFFSCEVLKVANKAGSCVIIGYHKTVQFYTQTRHERSNRQLALQQLMK